MTVTMSEPQPLRYDAASVRSFTECHLGLEFTPLGSGIVHQDLQAIKVSIHSGIRVKTFYSVKPFAHLPSQTLLGDDGKTRLRDEILKLKKREIPYVS
jgi:hypothetical protein